MKNSVQKSTGMLTVAYAAGPGDVLGTYCFWREGERDPREVSEAFSGLFYQTMRNLSSSAYVVSSHPAEGVHIEDWITIEHRPRPSMGKSGLAYHLAELSYWLGVICSIRRSGARVAIVDDMEHWWLLSLLRLAGVHVIPDLHCTFWPKGYRPSGPRHRVVQALNGWFWRHIPTATICISPECERQARELAGPQIKGEMIQARPSYMHGYLDTIQKVDWHAGPFRLLFAGRLEHNKGIFDLLEVAERVRTEIAGSLLIEVCGAGTAEQAFLSEIERRGLANEFQFNGQLDRQGMWDAYARCHAVVVPTQSSFAEGLNRVVVESVLAGRPVIATNVCPATEVVSRSVIEIAPGDVEAMAEAVLKLASDFEFYESKRAGCKIDDGAFYDAEQSWAMALGRAISAATQGEAK